MFQAGDRRSFALCLTLALTAPVLPAFAQETGEWYALDVPGGRQTLTVLGVPERRERAAVMVELIRRLHFSTHAPIALEAGLRDLLPAGDRSRAKRQVVTNLPALDLPLPLAPQTWSAAVFGRDVPASRLFAEILNDPSARLLYHGLAGMDRETRLWMNGQPALIRRLYKNKDAIAAFAMFAPAVQVVGGRIVVPGGGLAERLWSTSLGVDTASADRFVSRLFEHNSGRTAGLYFTIAVADAPRRAFLLNVKDGAEEGAARFKRLVSGFADCYPQNATTYPFAVRSHDAALLLMEVRIDAAGALAGPQSMRLWRRVLEGGDLLSTPESESDDDRDVAADAAWMVETLCRAEAARRGPIFDVFLAAHRVFTEGVDGMAEAVVALRARMLYPAVFMALEHAGVRRSGVYAAVARHAAGLARLADPERAITGLRQFQGVLAMTVTAAAANTLTLSQAERLLESLAAVPFTNERYGGRLVDWFDREWLPSVRPSSPVIPGTSIEAAVAEALAGPAQTAPRSITWEGLDYVVDVPGFERRRLLEVRRRQGGVTVDSVMTLNRIANELRTPGLAMSDVKRLAASLSGLQPQLSSMTRAQEFGDDGPDVLAILADLARRLSRIDTPQELARVSDASDELGRCLDFLFAHAAAAWAYAPHVGGADSGALVGGDGSLRHDFGVRSIGRSKFARRWDLPVTGSDSGSASGSLLGIQAALARWSLRRVSDDAVPAAPTMSGTDQSSFMLTAALSNARTLTDEALVQIAGAVTRGTNVIKESRADPERLMAAATAAALSPWRRATLTWLVHNESERLDEQFSISERARLGGLRADQLPAWGAAAIVTGCLCLEMPAARIPEATVGRAADGLAAGQSTDLMLRIAMLLSELEMPAPLATAVLSYAMRGFLDAVKPVHAADFDAFTRQAGALDRRTVEDYLAAIAAIGPLRPAALQQ